MVVCRRFQVSGRVQGVAYRACTRMRATELGVSGYARNLPDGRVEVLACGATEAVASLEQWLWQGPPAAHVEQVHGTDALFEPHVGFTCG